MKILKLIYPVLLLILCGSTATCFGQTFDLEYIYDKDSIGRESPPFQLNLIAKYQDYNLSEVSKIHIEASNSFKDDRKGQIDKVSLVVEPDKGFVVRDSAMGVEVDKYLHKEVSLSQAQAQVQTLSKNTSLLLHPKLFVFSEENMVKIDMGIYSSGEVLFDYQVFIEMDDGFMIPLKISRIETILN